MEIQSTRISHFGAYEFNHRSNELFLRGYRIQLQGQPARVLAALLEAAGQVVSREDLRALIWPEDTNVDFEASLNTAIKKIRHALHDSPQEPKFLQTVHGRGYRFIGSVYSVSADVAEPSAPAPAPMAPETETTVGNGRRKRILAVGLALAALIGAALVYARLRSPAPQSIDSVAVLPFANADPETEFLSDGISDEIIDDLARSAKVRVISRASSFQFKGKSVNPEKAGRQLGARALVTGRVFRHPDAFIVQSELVDTENGARLWAGSYRQTLAAATPPPALPLDEEIGRQIAREVRKKIAPDTPMGATEAANSSTAHDPEEHTLYLRAYYHWNKRSPAETALAITDLKKVLQLDPNYAAAWATLADCYGYPRHSFIDTFGDTKAAVQRALEIDPNLPQAHAVSGMIKMHEWDWSGAERAFRRTLELNPSDATAHEWFAILLRALGDTERERDELHKASTLDPLSLIVGVQSGWTEYFAGGDGAAIEAARKVLELDRNFLWAYQLLGYAYLRQGARQEAVASFRKALDLSDNNPTIAGDLGYAYAVAGQKEEARKILAQLQERSRNEFVPAGALAWVYLGLGDRDRFFAFIDRAREERYRWLIYARVWGVFDSVRADPRFHKLLVSLNLAV